MTRFERDGKVSIWLFRNAEDPADAGKDILKEFCGVDRYDSDFQEGAYFKEPTILRSLIVNLSYSDSFIDSVLSVTDRLRIQEAFGVIAQFNFEYDPTKVEQPISDDPTFIGSFDWHD